MAQKELKELYTEELKKVWGNDDRMVEFCRKQAEYIIEHNSGLFEIEKPSIKKDFCFGYGYCGISDDTDRQNASVCAAIAKTNEGYFIEKNLEPIERKIQAYKDMRFELSRNWADGEYPLYTPTVVRKYYTQSGDCKIRDIHIVNTYLFPLKDTDIIASIELIDKFIAGYEVVKEAFTKRLHAYLKRYGMSKVNSWTYLVD